MYNYNEQAISLVEHDDIYAAWLSGRGMFKKVGYGLKETEDGWAIIAGCLTQIRGYSSMGAFIKGEYNEEITKEIKNDERIPKNSDDIKPEHFPIFIEWQQRIDKLQEENNES